MRLVLVHGRAQGGLDAEVLQGAWTAALERGVWANGLDPLAPDLEVRFPYYGDELDRVTATRRRGDAVVARGPGDTPDRFQAELLAELAERAGVTPEEIVAELQEPAVERGFENWAWTQATGRALSRRAPWLAGAVLRGFLADVDAYLRRPSARRAVNAVVTAAITGHDGPVVVVGHSLGSVVAYDVLDALGSAVSVPLLVTLGSPLGIEVVKRHLTHPLGMPPGVARWLNGADERDPVALHSRLDRDVFPADIDNISDIHNRRDHAHAIEDYLVDERVARAIATALLD